MMNQSCNEKDFVNNQHLCKKLFKCCFVFCFFLISESFIKLLIQGSNLEKEKREAIEEILIQTVQAFNKFNDHSGNMVEGLKSLTDNLHKVYKALLVTVREGSMVVIPECPTLESLGEGYLVTDEMKKLNLETTCLKTTIDEENYLDSKKAVMELPSTCSGEYKQNVWEVQLDQVLHEESSLAFQFQECTICQLCMERSAIMIIIIVIVIRSTTLMMITLIAICIAPTP